MEPKSEVHKRRSSHRNLRTNTGHDPFILKFPPEIASHIFCLSAEEPDYEPESFGLNLKTLPTPFILGSVCQEWRQLAWSTPQLWSSISFTLTKPPKNKGLNVILFINDWLERSRSLPLDVWVHDDRHLISREHYGPIIDALNQHSGRWHTLCLYLYYPSFFGLFCGTSPPSNLRSLHLISIYYWEKAVHFRMDSRPSPTRLTIDNFQALNIDIVWDNLRYLKAWDTGLDSCLEVIQRAPHLQSCSLLANFGRISSPLPTTIVRHMYLRELELFDFPAGKLIEFLNLMELPSLEEYRYDYHDPEFDGGDIAAGLVSLLNRSGCHLKVLKLELRVETPAMEDIQKLLNAVPHLQEFHLKLRHPGPKTSFVMDDLFLQLSSSPPVLEGGAPGLLPDLQSLKLYSAEGYMFDCIPDIFSWPHRKMLSLQVDGSRKIVLDKDTSHKISNLIDQEFKICILQDGRNYFSCRSLD